MAGLSEREEKFLKMIFDQTGGDVSELVLTQDLYPVATKMGFNEREVTSISEMLEGLGLLEIVDTYKGVIDGKPVGFSMIAALKITSLGVMHVRNID